MAALPENQAAEKKPAAILAAHNGALGDFLCCWPGLLAIARHFRTQCKPQTPLYFLGREFMRLWTLPLGYAPCPPDLRQAAEELYVAAKIAAPLTGGKIFWFCLDKPPRFPCLQTKNPPEIIPLPILRPRPLQGRKDSSTEESAYAHVSLNLKTHLEASGLSYPMDWREVWHTLFGSWRGQKSKEIALLPGSGHRNKEWPLACFIDLADKLAKQGWKPIFIIGEAELERGLLPPAAHKWEAPSPPQALAERLRGVRAIVSNDAGPAHLAGLCGVPGVVLFGPTPPEVWGVPGMANINRFGLCNPVQAGAGEEQKKLKLKLNFNLAQSHASSPACGPCSVNLRNIACSAPLCMESLSPALVWRALTSILNEDA